MKTLSSDFFLAFLGLATSQDSEERTTAAAMLNGEYPEQEAVLFCAMCAVEKDIGVQHELMLAGGRIIETMRLHPQDVIDLVCEGTAHLIGRDPAYESDPPEEFKTSPLLLDPDNDFDPEPPKGNA